MSAIGYINEIERHIANQRKLEAENARLRAALKDAYDAMNEPNEMRAYQILRDGLKQGTSWTCEEVIQCDAVGT
jgi:hypothetical protein